MKTCKEHIENPVHVYRECAGCELKSLREERDKARAECKELRKDAMPLEPVTGDQLPPIGSTVLIHLGRSDAWLEHTVVGYHAWCDLAGNENLHRVFVRVRDADGCLNARLLKDVRPQPAISKRAAQ